MSKKDIIKHFIIRFFYFIPIHRNYIICNNFLGRGYDENPRYIAEELRKNKKNRVFWILSRENARLPLPDNVEPLIVGTLKYFYIIAVSRVWIFNVRIPLHFTKRKGQYYIQTWHGDLGLKKVEYSVIDKLSDTYIQQMKLDNQLADYFTSGSKFFTNIIRKDFRYTGKILKYGQPKSDPVLHSNHIKEKKKLKSEFNIKEDNLLVYMPTFRSDYSHDPYNIKLDELKSMLEKKTNKTWRIICKLHPNVTEEYKKINCSNYLSLDNYANTQQLIIASDLFISDYSSVSFDAMLAKRPVLIYANDEKIYTKHERGLCFKLSDLPFPYFSDNNSLMHYINTKSISNIPNQYKKFIKEQEVNISGTAAKDIANFITTHLLT